MISWVTEADAFFRAVIVMFMGLCGINIENCDHGVKWQ